MERLGKRGGERNGWGLLAGLLLALSLASFLPGRAWAAASVGWDMAGGLDRNGSYFGSSRYDPPSEEQYPDQISLTAEVGQEVYLGDYFVSRSAGGTVRTGAELAATYFSADPSIAAVNQNTGYLIALEEGTVPLTVSYKGKQYVCGLKVVEKGAFGVSSTYRKLNRYAAALASYYGNPVSGENIVPMLKALANWDREWAARRMDVKRQQYPERLYVPLYPRCLEVSQEVRAYVNTHNPLDFSGKYAVRVRSARVSVSGNVLTLKLSRAITREQLYLLQYIQNEGLYYSRMQKFPAYSATKVVYGLARAGEIRVFLDTGKSTSFSEVYGRATFRKGSSMVRIRLYGDRQYQTVHRIKKSYRYSILVGENRELEVP